MQPTPPQDPALRQARRRALRAGIALAVCAGWAQHALAQATRTFPAQARLGRLEMRVFPEAILNAEPVRLGAGARIYNERNMIVMPSALSGSVDVLVERDPAGQIWRVWMLDADELRAAQLRERERADGVAAGQGR